MYKKPVNKMPVLGQILIIQCALVLHVLLISLRQMDEVFSVVSIVLVKLKKAIKDR